MIRLKEKIYQWGFGLLAFASLLFLVGITLTLFLQGAPLFKSVPFFEVLLGKNWYPTHEPPEYGFLPLIAASVWVTVGAMFVCVPLGVGSALYLNELAGVKQRAILKPLIEILAGIPSIVFGFFGMTIVAPLLQRWLHLPVGLCGFTASLILGVMSVPTVCSIAEDALSYVPASFREASYALGADRWQTLIKVVIPAAGSGISTAVILGMSRAIGETMTVLMVAGGAAVIPANIFVPMRPMTAAIAAEMGETAFGTTHFQALFAIGLVLFAVTFVFNIFAELVSRQYRLKLGLGQ